MTTVDSEGRITVPADLRESLDLAPGMVVEVYEEDGNLVIEPEVPPEEIIEQLHEAIEEVNRNPNGQTVPDEEMGPVAREHRDSIREGAKRADATDGTDAQE